MKTGRTHYFACSARIRSRSYLQRGQFEVKTGSPQPAICLGGLPPNLPFLALALALALLVTPAFLAAMQEGQTN
jgi:hypothetical protein